MLTVKLKISVSLLTEAEIMGFRKGFLILSLYLKNINLIERLLVGHRYFYERVMCIL